MIPVTKPFLPPKEEYDNFLNGIWERNWLTNNGPLVNDLELKLKDHLNIKHLLFVTNGTIAIQIAIKALGLKGEIITTPFSYVATTSSIVWENCEPIFVDIDQNTLNIDPQKIEEAITPKTSAILATHCFGNACDIDAIQNIASKHQLKVIYDAAHCFGGEYKGRSIFAYGDISTTSFHSTKLYHTIEGGAVMTNDPGILKTMAFMRNFGHDGPEHFSGLGINGKNSEFHAAMGLANLNHIASIIEKRKILSTQYDTALRNFKGKKPALTPKCTYNFAYYPIIFPTEEFLMECLKKLNALNIFPRRYFYPSLETLPYVKNSKPMDVSSDISKRILCLPLYVGLSKEEVEMICRVILRIQNN